MFYGISHDEPATALRSFLRFKGHRRQTVKRANGCTENTEPEQARLTLIEGKQAGMTAEACCSIARRIAERDSMTELRGFLKRSLRLFPDDRRLQRVAVERERI